MFSLTPRLRTHHLILRRKKDLLQHRVSLVPNQRFQTNSLNHSYLLQILLIRLYPLRSSKIAKDKKRPTGQRKIRLMFRNLTMPIGREQRNRMNVSLSLLKEILLSLWLFRGFQKLVGTNTVSFR